MERAANQPVRPEFFAQCAKLLALAILQQGLCHAERASKSRDDSSHGRDLHLRGGIPYQIDFSIPDLPAHRHPLPIDRDARALPFERLQMLLLEESFETPFGMDPSFSNHADGRALRGLRDQPVKVRRVIRHEPHARGIWRTISWEPDDGLNERHGFDGRPSRGARHPARCAVCANDTVRVQFLALAAGFHFQSQSARIRADSQKTSVKGQPGPSLLCLAGQSGNQPGSLNDEVRLRQRDLRRAAIGKQFKSPNFVNDTLACRCSHLVAELIGDNECARYRFELRFRFQHTDSASAARYARRRKQSGCGTPDDDDFPFAPAWPELIFHVPHGFCVPRWRAFPAKINHFGCHGEKLNCFPSSPCPPGNEMRERLVSIANPQGGANLEGLQQLHHMYRQNDWSYDAADDGLGAWRS